MVKEQAKPTQIKPILSSFRRSNAFDAVPPRFVASTKILLTNQSHDAAKRGSVATDRWNVSLLLIERKGKKTYFWIERENFMSLSRRQIIEAGDATGALAVMASSPLLAATIDPTPIRRRPETAPAPTTPAQPRVMVDPVVDPRLVRRARAAFDRHRGQIARPEIVGIVDFTKTSSVPRFYLLDTNTGRVTRHYVSHGRGSDPGHTGFLHRFSNIIGSEATSDGAYLVGNYYHGKYGRSMRVSGLDPSNSNAETRAIVVHTAWYAEPEMIAQHGRLGRSEGCFALPNSSLQEVMARLGPGHFLYADRVA
jgi:hypothetical protein